MRRTTAISHSVVHGRTRAYDLSVLVLRGAVFRVHECSAPCAGAGPGSAGRTSCGDRRSAAHVTHDPHVSLHFSFDFDICIVPMVWHIRSRLASNGPRPLCPDVSLHSEHPSRENDIGGPQVAGECPTEASRRYETKDTLQSFGRDRDVFEALLDHGSSENARDRTRIAVAVYFSNCMRCGDLDSDRCSQIWRIGDLSEFQRGKKLDLDSSFR